MPPHHILPVLLARCLGGDGPANNAVSLQPKEGGRALEPMDRLTHFVLDVSKHRPDVNARLQNAIERFGVQAPAEERRKAVEDLLVEADRRSDIACANVIRDVIGDHLSDLLGRGLTLGEAAADVIQALRSNSVIELPSGDAFLAELKRMGRQIRRATSKDEAVGLAVAGAKTMERMLLLQLTFETARQGLGASPDDAAVELGLKLSTGGFAKATLGTQLSLFGRLLEASSDRMIPTEQRNMLNTLLKSSVIAPTRNGLVHARLEDYFSLRSDRDTRTECAELLDALCSLAAALVEGPSALFPIIVRATSFETTLGGLATYWVVSDREGDKYRVRPRELLQLGEVYMMRGRTNPNIIRPTLVHFPRP